MWGACEEQCGSEDEVASEDEESERGKEVESESEETEAPEVLERSSVVMALGAHDGRRQDAPRSRVPRCRVVDVGTCDSILTREQLAIIWRTFNVPFDHKFILSSLGYRIRTPPDEYFTIYAAYFDSGFFIRPTSLPR
ncbi:UNVERIFIED_CONTAM: hypothetical protein Slati_4606300 [Sesamum latifolium]|uniref:Uncharacterized protein n=1 Tax=Sesamum latifolium TaxID=2727402 RepID=A0AAW2S411_9LAMI